MLTRCLSLIVLSTLFCLGGCFGARDDPQPRPVVIAIDSADWTVIDGLLAEGRMPNLAALRERGTSGPSRGP